MGPLTVSIPASLASGAHQAGEESELFVYLLARAIDCRGSGRVWEVALLDAAEEMMSRKNAMRVLQTACSARYWRLDGAWVALVGAERLTASIAPPMNTMQRARSAG